MGLANKRSSSSSVSAIPHFYGEFFHEDNTGDFVIIVHTYFTPLGTPLDKSSFEMGDYIVIHVHI